MSTDNTITKTDLKNILEEIGNIGGGGGTVDSTSVPTASKVSEFDSNAKMNSTDMTSGEVTTFVNGLDVTGGSLGDFVTEQGTSGIWTYRKWNSGKYECWGDDSQSWGMTTSVGSAYYGQKTYNITSLGFQTINDIQVTGNCAAYYIATKVETYSATSLTLTAFSLASRTDTVRHFIYIVGTWK